MPPASDTLPGLLAALLAADGTRPLVTFYDDTAPSGGTATRIELSVASFENAVAKTANLLQDELGTEPGEPVCLLLPCHWQSAVWVFSVAACGLRLVSDPTTADVVVCGPQTLSRAVSAGARDVVAMALTPFGGTFTEPLPPGVLDHGRDAPGQPALGEFAGRAGERAGVAGSLQRGEADEVLERGAPGVGGMLQLAAEALQVDVGHANQRGGGAQDASPEVTALSDMLQAPVACGFRRGQGVLDSRSPFSATLPLGRELWGEADVVLAVGTRLFFEHTMWGVDDDLSIINVNADPDETADVELSIGSAKQLSGQVLTAPAMDSRNRFGAAEQVHPVPFHGARWRKGKLSIQMPAKSIVVLTLK